MNIDDTTLNRLSLLAKIDISDEEQIRLKKQLTAIVDFVQQLEQADTTAVQPTNQVTGLQSVMRPDTIDADYDREEMLATMPDTTGDGHLRVHAVFNKEKDD